MLSTGRGDVMVDLLCGASATDLRSEEARDAHDVREKNIEA